MPATRWTRSYSDDDEEASSAYNGAESSSSVNNGIDRVSEEASDDITLLARRVLADLEAFFDHELLGDDDEDGDVASQESDDTSAERGGPWSGAISLDELSVVLNASIQRHQPVANAVTAQGVPREKKSREKADRQVHAKRPQQQRHQLPFAHFQHQLEQKTQLFRAKCRDVRRESRLQAQEKRHGQRREVSSWSSRGLDGSRSISSGNEEETKEEQDFSGSEDPDESEESSGGEGESEEESVVESVASSVGAASGDHPGKKEEAPFGRSSSINIFPTTTRDALTQATLMQDQEQQTSVSETRVASSLGFATKFPRARSEEKDEGKGEAFVSGDENEDPLVRRGKWSLSFQSVDSPTMTPVKASADSNSVASSSSARSCIGTEEFNRLRRIHRQSDNRRNQPAETLREAESQTTPAKAPQPPVVQQSTKDHEKKGKAVVYHQEQSVQKILTPLPLPHLKPQTWELDLSNFNA
ncbi:hypothetical protein Gpo141_00006775 [Globisporangium polare]